MADEEYKSKPTDFFLNVPEEFRAILQTFTAERLHDAYPKVILLMLLGCT